MDGAWYVVLRDIMVILAAAAVVTTSVFTLLVAWQIYRLLQEVRDESRPIIQTVRDTAATVQDAAAFMRHRTVPPVAAVTGLGVGAARLVGQLAQFYRGLHRDDAPVTRVEG
jgi:hypothetical protein